MTKDDSFKTRIALDKRSSQQTVTSKSLSRGSFATLGVTLTLVKFQCRQLLQLASRESSSVRHAPCVVQPCAWHGLNPNDNTETDIP
jgi:hypothetical protein